MWRGEPFADVAPTRAVTAEAHRLIERQLAVVELRLTTDLAAGRYDEVLDELAAITVLHPYRERFRGLLMHALYATGRKADALAVYQVGRELMIERTGMELGAELQSLQRRILRDVLPVALDRARHHTRRAVPRLLPPDAADLIGRAGETAAVRAVLRPRDPDAAAAPVVVVSGKPGMGKSVLAVCAAHQIADRFPDGQLWANLGRDTPDAAGALTTFLTAAGIPEDNQPRSTAERLSRYREWMAHRRVLVVLDDAVHAQQVRLLTPANNGSALIVTSRSAMAAVEGARHIECGPLEDTDGLQMLRGIVGADRVAAEPDVCRNLVAACENRPLAIRIVGSLALARRDTPLRDLLRRVHTDPLGELSWSDLALRPRLRDSYERLGDTARTVFHRLGTLGDRFVLRAVADASCMDDADARRALDRLVETYLVDVDGDTAFVLDRFVLAYARELG
jgi:hypothetical protein